MFNVVICYENMGNLYHVSSNTTVEELKDQIQQHFGIPKRSQRLIYNGQEISTGTMAHHRITERSLIKLEHIDSYGRQRGSVGA